MGAVLTGYLGLLLMGAVFLAVGLFVSSLTENQIVAGFGTFGVLLASGCSAGAPSSRGGALRTVLQHLSIIEHMDSFAEGVIDTKDLVYYLTGDGPRAVPHAALARVEAVAGLGADDARSSARRC